VVDDAQNPSLILAPAGSSSSRARSISSASISAQLWLEPAKSQSCGNTNMGGPMDMPLSSRICSALKKGVGDKEGG